MKLDPGIFKAYDIRGIYPTEIDEVKMESIIKGIYTFFIRDLKKSNLSVVLGRDMRVSSPSLFNVAKKTLMSLGATVIDIGLVSTPTFYFALQHYGYDVGIQISASHNPAQYTGAKFAKRMDGRLQKVSKLTGMEEVKKLVINSDFVQATAGGKEVVKSDVLLEDVKDSLMSVSLGKPKKFKIVADPANAMGSLYIEELFKQIPADLVKMNFELDGTFPVHQPDPLEFKNLEDLCKRVVKEKADFGIAPDGDGDRIFFIDEKGRVVPATLISALIAREVLMQHPGGKIIVDIRYTRNVENMVKKLGGTSSISVVGHALITEKLNKEHAVFAGESSGHFYFKETGGGESSLRVILYVIKALMEEDKPLSEIVASYRTSIESGEYNFIMQEGTVPKKLLEEIAAKFSDGTSSWLDGLAVDYPEWRFNIRTSNTEPLLRLNVEGNSKELVSRKLNLLTELIISSGAKSKH